MGLMIFSLKQDGYSLIKEVMANAVPSEEFAISEAEASIAAIEATHQAHQQIEAEAIDRGLKAVADLSTQLQRELFAGQLATALFGIVSKKTLVTKVAHLVTQYKQERDDVCRETERQRLKRYL